VAGTDEKGRMRIGDIRLKKSGPKGHERILKGTVIKVYPLFYLVDFGYYREAFQNYGEE
jgi:hypothetical protein